jgi:predicted ester cyclase
MTTLDEHKVISRRWHEAWGTPAIDAAYAECLADDFRANFFARGWISRDAYIRYDRRFAAAFSNTRMLVQEAVAEGDLVMSRMIWRGVHTGPIEGAPEPTHKPFEVVGFALDRFRERRIVEHVPLFDQYTLFDQLGLLRAAREA